MKLKTTHAMAFCALSLLATQPVWALGPALPGESTNLVVKGSIEASPCSIDLSGKVDFGPIEAGSIGTDPTGHSLPKPPAVGLVVDCGATPTVLGIGFKDNYPGTSIKGLKIVSPIKDTETLVPDDNSYGLGTTKSGKPIGSYMIGMLTPPNNYIATYTANTGAREDPISTKKIINSSWQPNGLIIAPYASSGPEGIAPTTRLTADLQVRATVAPIDELKPNEPIEIKAGTKLIVYYY